MKLEATLSFCYFFFFVPFSLPSLVFFLNSELFKDFHGGCYFGLSVSYILCYQCEDTVQHRFLEFSGEIGCVQGLKNKKTKQAVDGPDSWCRLQIIDSV